MRAVLVICEGNHDVAFVTRSLGALVDGADFFKEPINKLPTPFSTKHDPKKPTQPIYNGIIAERYGLEAGSDGSMKHRDVNARNLREAARAPVPTFEAVMTTPADGTLYVVLHAYLRKHAEPTDRIHRGPTDHKKAQIGVTGQFLFPGGSMTEVIGNRERGLSRERFTGPVSRALVEFLRGVPW